VPVTSDASSSIAERASLGGPDVPCRDGWLYGLPALVTFPTWLGRDDNRGGPDDEERPEPLHGSGGGVAGDAGKRVGGVDGG
jgi:hypothetical protein